MSESKIDLRHLTAEIVGAFVSNNSVRSDELQELIGATYSALEGAGKPTETVVEKPVAAVSIKKSITPDYLISLEDGKQYRTLRRHLAGRGLTPAGYKEKWGLPTNYPMVAPSYAARRSELAREFGFGQTRATRKAVAAAVKPTRARKAKPPNALA